MAKALSSLKLSSKVVDAGLAGAYLGIITLTTAFHAFTHH